MDLLFLFFLFCCSIYFILKFEKFTKDEVNFHFIKPFKLSGNSDFSDKRTIYIKRFQDAENLLTRAQANCIQDFNINTIQSLRFESGLPDNSKN